MARKKKATSVPKELEEEASTKTEKKVNGRPVSIASVEEMEPRILEYLNTLPRWGLPTKAGLAFALGVHRDTLNSYEKKEGFSDVLKAWYMFFEDRWVQNLARPHATGTIFYLKNTYGYVDKYDNDMTSGGKAIQFTVPQEIAEKHKLVVLEVERQEQKVLVEDAESAV